MAHDSPKGEPGCIALVVLQPLGLGEDATAAVPAVQEFPT